MTDDTATAPSLDARDFLAAFDLDCADAKDICVYHENGSLIIAVELNIRNHRCPVCGKTFYEEKPFVPDGFKVSVATIYNVLSELKRPECTFTSIADKYNLSASSVSSIFDSCIDIGRRPLPGCICFDEVFAFKSRDSDYVCVLPDYADKKIIDILPSRRKRYLSDYLFKIPVKERSSGAQRGNVLFLQEYIL